MIEDVTVKVTITETGEQKLHHSFQVEDGGDVAVDDSETILKLTVPDVEFHITFNIDPPDFVFPDSPGAAITWKTSTGSSDIPPAPFGDIPIVRSSPTTCVLQVTSSEQGQPFPFSFNVQQVTAEGVLSPIWIIDPTIVTGPDT